MCLGHPHDVDVCPSPFHACKGALNTICSEKKSTSRVEVFCPLTVSVTRVLFGPHWDTLLVDVSPPDNLSTSPVQIVTIGT